MPINIEKKIVKYVNNADMLCIMAAQHPDIYISDGRFRIPARILRITQEWHGPISVELVASEIGEEVIDPSYFRNDSIKKVIYNAPNAVIVFWTDGTKTVVKCGKNDTWDPEKGLAMAIAKKFLGNKGNYYNILKKHLPDE